MAHEMDNANSYHVPSQSVSKPLNCQNPNAVEALPLNHALPSFVVDREQQFSLASISIGERSDWLTLSGMTLQCSFFWARNAIFHCLTALRIQPEEEILVPAFICS